MERTKRLHELLQGVDCRIEGDHPSGAVIASVVTDSRKAGPGSLFVAVRGLHADGHDFIEAALRQGCTAVMAEEGREVPRLAGCQAVRIRVRDSRIALGAIAAAVHDHPADELTLIGITGTNGKTTSSYLIESIVAASGGRPGVIGTVNYRFAGRVLPATHTTPDPLALHGLFRSMVNTGVTHVVMEVSSHALDQRRLQGLVFDVALFTNLSRDHLDYHGTMAAYLTAKKKLFLEHLKSGGVAVVCRETGVEESDAAAGEVIAAVGEGGTRLLTCGLGEGNAVRARQWTVDFRGVEAEVLLAGQAVTVKSPLVGRFNLDNILGACGVGCALGVAPERIAVGIASLSGVPGRLERVSDGRGGMHVLVDYAHTPDALEKVLATLRGLGRGRLIVVFGCGGDRDPGKRPMMGEIAGRLADVVIVTADNSRSESTEAIAGAIETGLQRAGRTRISLGADAPGETSDGYGLLLDRAQAIRAAIRLADPGDAVAICGKGHETSQIMREGTVFFDDRQQARQALDERFGPATPVTGGGNGQDWHERA